MICIGRLIFGFSVGVLQVVGPAFTFETMPSSMMGLCGPYMNVLINMGILIGSMMSLTVPSQDADDYLTSESWRFVFGVPAFM